MSPSGCDEMPTERPSSIQKRAWMACVRSASDSPTRKARTSSDFGQADGQAGRAQPRDARPRARRRWGCGAHPQRPTMRQPPEIANVFTAASPPMLSIGGPGGCRSWSATAGRTAGTRGGASPGALAERTLVVCSLSSQATEGTWKAPV